MAEGNDQEKQIMTVIFTANYFSKIFVYSYNDIEGSNSSHAFNVTLTATILHAPTHCVCGVEVSTFNLLKGSGSNPDIKSVMSYKEVKEMKINWLDESSLTYEEAMELLSHSHEKRLEMEDKNKWDAYVNDFTFWTFLNDTYGYMLNEAKEEVDDFYLKYFYPKVREIIDWEVILNRTDKLAKDVLKQEGKENIWEIVEDWWEVIFKILYFY